MAVDAGEVRHVLRLTNLVHDEHGARMKVEGAVVSFWSAVLEDACRPYLQHQGPVVLDCSDLILVDCRAVTTLRKLTGSGLQLIHCPPLILDLIRECRDH